MSDGALPFRGDLGGRGHNEAQLGGGRLEPELADLFEADFVWDYKHGTSRPCGPLDTVLQFLTPSPRA